MVQFYIHSSLGSQSLLECLLFLGFIELSRENPRFRHVNTPALIPKAVAVTGLVPGLQGMPKRWDVGCWHSQGRPGQARLG